MTPAPKNNPTNERSLSTPEDSKNFFEEHASAMRVTRHRYKRIPEEIASNIPVAIILKIC